jgi:glycosyltransferase involved in cell wall biosynthesis
MDKNLVSVIMPVYNAEKFLSESIKSILNQTYPNFEFIIINDGSTDNSKELISSFKDERIRAYDFTNQGCSRQRNFGLSVAKGEIIALMDADDISASDRFEVQLNFLKSNEQIHVLGSNCFNIDENGKIKNEKKFPEFHKEIEFMAPILCPVCHASIMTYRKILVDCGGYLESHKVAGDHELILRLISQSYKIQNIQKNLYLRRIWKNSLSNAYNSLQKQNHYKNGIQYLSKINCTEYNFNCDLYRRGLLEYYYGDISEARKYFLKALLKNSVSPIRLLRLILVSLLGNKIIGYLRKKGILIIMNKIVFKLFRYNLQKV